ncbi:MAG: hypothetical protein HPY81_10065 [Firmicutes bacterium]|nr:hypothetical protein [Bacillota bacterium]
MEKALVMLVIAFFAVIVGKIFKNNALAAAGKQLLFMFFGYLFPLAMGFVAFVVVTAYLDTYSRAFSELSKLGIGLLAMVVVSFIFSTFMAKLGAFRDYHEVAREVARKEEEERRKKRTIRGKY